MKKITVILIVLILYLPQAIYSQSSFNFEGYVVESLKKINDRIDKLNDRIDKLNDRIDKLNDRIDKVDDKVDNRFYTIFLAMLGGFTGLFIFIAQRTQPFYREVAKEAQTRAKSKTKKVVA